MRALYPMCRVGLGAVMSVPSRFVAVAGSLPLVIKFRLRLYLPSIHCCNSDLGLMLVFSEQLWAATRCILIFLPSKVGNHLVSRSQGNNLRDVHASILFLLEV